MSSRCWLMTWRFHSFLEAKFESQPAKAKTQRKGRVCCFLMWFCRPASSLKLGPRHSGHCRLPLAALEGSILADPGRGAVAGVPATLARLADDFSSDRGRLVPFLARDVGVARGRLE